MLLNPVYVRFQTAKGFYNQCTELGSTKAVQAISAQTVQHTRQSAGLRQEDVQPHSEAFPQHTIDSVGYFLDSSATPVTQNSSVKPSSRETQQSHG